MSVRTEKISAKIHTEAAKYFASIGRLAFLLTVTHVDVSADLRNAVVRVALTPEPTEKELATFFGSHTKPLAAFIAGKSTTKFTPRVTLKLDTGSTYAAEISRLLA